MSATGLEPRTTYYVNEHSNIWPNWPNGWVFLYELSSSGFEFSCSHDNWLICDWYSSRATLGISFFRVPTKDDEYSINWRNNIQHCCSYYSWYHTVLKAILKNDKLKTEQFQLHYPQKSMICHKQIIPTKLHFSLY